MINSGKLSKEKITRAILDIVNPDYTKEHLDSCMLAWWINIRKTGGYSLTETGHRMFTMADIEFYEIPVNFYKGINGKLLELDREIPCPFYIYLANKKEFKLKIYDSRIATMIILHGDIESYLSRKR